MQSMPFARLLFLLIAMVSYMPLALLASDESLNIPKHYHVELPRIPEKDLSGTLGPRLLKLLSIQVERNMRYLDNYRQQAGIRDKNEFSTDMPYFQHGLGGTAHAIGVLYHFGEADKTMGGMSREKLVQTGKAMVQSIARNHKLGGGKRPGISNWSIFGSGRFAYQLGMGAWLLWDELPTETQLLVARILEYEADRYLDLPAPTQLLGGTQAESNAWNGGGLAVVSCMLKSHPHSELWAAKANEYMISAYAAAQDVISDKVVDGKPLKKWLTSPNVYPDYTLENHEIFHPDYLAAISEMVRCAIAFPLADRPLPQATTFNANTVLDLLLFLLLPDGSLLYAHGTDYTPRRLGSFFQACDIVPLKPNPLRKSCFIRSLESLEKMAAERPDSPMGGWIGLNFDLSCTWGLTQNYMMCRLYGDGGYALPDDRIEANLAGVRVFKHVKCVVHRTPESISSFSWHLKGPRFPARMASQLVEPSSALLGLTMPLDRDVLCYPIPWGYIGEVREAPENTGKEKKSSLKLSSHQVSPREDGFSVMVGLDWCSGKVRQNSAFVSLPNGISVYFEERTAEKDVVIEFAKSGNIVFFDDLRWHYQVNARSFFGSSGNLTPDASKTQPGNWLNVDDRMGYVVLNKVPFRLFKRRGKPAIWRGDDTMYDTCRLEFVHFASNTNPKAVAKFKAGERISVFAMVSCPNRTKEETAVLADSICGKGWLLNERGVLALKTPSYLVYTNDSAHSQLVHDGAMTQELGAKTSGWILSDPN